MRPAAGFTLPSAATRNFAWLAGDKGVATLLGLLVFGLIARRYGPVGSGHYAFALTLLQTALGLSLVCSSAAILPRLTRMRRGVGGALANVFVVRLFGSLAAMLAVAVYAFLAIGDGDRLLIALLVIAAVPFVEPFLVATLYWQSRNDNRIPVINRGIGLGARTLVVALAVAYEAPLWVPALGWLLEAVLVACLQVRSTALLRGWRRALARVSAWRTSHYFHYGVRFLLGIALSQVFLRGDRLVLAQLLPAHEFGIYATAMQLVEVWQQVAQIVGVSIGPAFLYAALERQPGVLAHWRTLAALLGIGLSGLALAALLGREVLDVIFGPRFGASYPFLVAGTAFTTLAFVDVFATIRIVVRRQPFALALKWGASAAVAIASQIALFPALGAYAGPAGMSLGLMSGWVALALLHASQRTARRRVRPAEEIA
jgi:O-antigen/teichoic acid export membrane protein